jgi:enamine deaminase RidA (YjgF/YER057c/UK114 family)
LIFNARKIDFREMVQWRKDRVSTPTTLMAQLSRATAPILVLCEHDRMHLKSHRPTDGVYPATDDYAHAMEVRGAERLLFVAGTMGLHQDGTPGATLADQLDLIWSNIRAILASADMTVDNIVRVTSYLTDASYAEANAAARVAALGGRVVSTTAIVVHTLVNAWLVEIEVIAAA